MFHFIRRGHKHLPPLLPGYASKESKAPEIFKFTRLCVIVARVEAYRSQNGLTQLHL
jgi:hypothetical protein